MMETGFFFNSLLPSPIDFKLQPGGQQVNPQKLTQVSDWGSPQRCGLKNKGD
ncbi:hypothetical protein [Serratia marcescens]|uniref:hypothetical protein n=1 Tax=Serratia marcescens TaxID=615 RepID=UPI0016533DBC|nr:hypothetical protein [Serratia marcescens]